MTKPPAKRAPPKQGSKAAGGAKVVPKAKVPPVKKASGTGGSIPSAESAGQVVAIPAESQPNDPVPPPPPPPPPPPSTLPPPPGDAQVSSDPVLFALMMAVALSGALLIVGVAQREVRPLPATLVFIFGTLTLFTGYQVLRGLARGDAIEVNTHWGGLGGALGGWKLSAMATTLLFALILFGLTLAAGNGDHSVANNSLTNAASMPGNEHAEAPANNSADGNDSNANENADNGAQANAAAANVSAANLSNEAAPTGNAVAANAVQGRR
jgi:hypothetical protein